MKIKTFHQVIGWIAWSICTIAILLIGATKDTWAIETDLIYEVRMLASDNIRRASKGNEVSGYLYGLSAGLELKDKMSGENYLLGIVGGFEKVVYDVGDDFTTNTYRIYGDISEDLTKGYFLELSGLASREVDFLGYSDLDQRRTLQDRVIAKGTYGRKLANGSQWAGSFSGKYLEFQNEIQTTGEFSGNGDLVLSQRTKLHGDGYYRKGIEQNSQDEWDEGEITMGVSKKQSRTLLLGGQASWYTSKSYISLIDSSINWNHVRLLASQESVLGRSTKLGTFFGYEGVRSSDLGWDWGGTLALSFYAPLNHNVTDLGKVAEVKSIFFYGLDVSTLNDRTPILNNLLEFDADITWRPWRRTELTTGYRFAVKSFPGSAGTEETQNTANVEFRIWATKSTRVELAAFADQRDSDQDIFDLEEKRIEMKIVGSI